MKIRENGQIYGMKQNRLEYPMTIFLGKEEVSEEPTQDGNVTSITIGKPTYRSKSKYSNM